MDNLKHLYLYLKGHRDDLAIGKCFHEGKLVKKNLKKAGMYYLRAARQGKAEAFSQLSILSEDEGRMDESYYYLGVMHEITRKWHEAKEIYEKAASEKYAPAMYRLGQLYQIERLSDQQQVIIRKNKDIEFLWYRKAAVAYSAHALDTLIRLSDTEPEAAFHLAQMYELGEIGNKKNISTAVMYYEKASKLKHKEAAFRLGELYEFNDEGKKFNKDLQKAFDYYFIAGEQSHKEALLGLERITKILNNDTQKLKLAEVYQVGFNDKISALKIYKYLVDRKNVTASQQMNLLVKKDSICAYELARLYEQDNSIEENLQTAYYYYAVAMHNKHYDAKNYLKSSAKIGNKNAQYILGYEYYSKIGKFNKAAHWCILAAEKEQSQAIAYLNRKDFNAEQYLIIAKKYENGEVITKNMNLAIQFYEKACELKNKDAAFRLGEIYLNSSDLDKGNLKKAFINFIKAAQLNHPEALVMIESLASDMDPIMQFELAKVYHTGTFADQTKAMHWYQLASDGGYVEATKYLNDINTKKFNF